MADPEDDGSGGEFLRVRIVLDITRPLPRCCKLWAERKLVGWVGLKYEQLPNFCYLCGIVGHGDRDCEVWLRGKGRLRREDQHYGDWLRAEATRVTRKSVAVIAGASRSQAPWMKQKEFQVHNQSKQSGDSSQSNTMDNSGLGSRRVIKVKHASVPNPVVSPIVVVSQGSSSEREQVALNADGGFSEMQAVRLEKCMVGLTITKPMGL